MDKLRKITALLTLITLIGVLALLYICPMPMTGSRIVRSSCHFDNHPSISNTVGNCMDSQLAFAENTANTLSSAPFFFILFVLAISLSYIYTKYLSGLIDGICKQFDFFWRYRHRVKSLKEKYFLRYLTLLGSKIVVSNP